MTTNRELRHAVFMAVHDFLEDHYVCDCPRADPEGSHTAEALELTELVIGVVGTEWKPTPVGKIDVDLFRKHLRDGTVYVSRESDLPPGDTH